MLFKVSNSPRYLLVFNEKKAPNSHNVVAETFWHFCLVKMTEMINCLSKLLFFVDQLID